MEESIKWEAEQYIPFDINDVNIDFHILEAGATSPDGKDQMEVLLVAVKKDKLAEYTNLATAAGLNPVVVDVDAFSLENMYAANYDLREGEVVSLVNIGTNVINIHVLKGGVFSFTRDISLGSYKCTEAIQRDFHVSYDDAVRAQRLDAVEGVEEKAVLGIIDRLNVEIATEVSRSLDYFKTTSNQSQVHRIFLTGGAAKLPNLLARMEEKTGTTVELANPFNRIEIPAKSFDMSFIREMAPMAGVGVGLAMRRIGDR
jgi:type IV pilus assembly protein PilM